MLFEEANELSVGEALNRLRGKNTTLILSSGQSVSGEIVDGFDYSSTISQMVHLTALEGKELFDAFIPKAAIVGFMFRRPNA